MDLLHFVSGVVNWLVELGSSMITIVSLPTFVAMAAVLIITIKIFSVSKYLKTKTHIAMSSEEKIPIIFDNIINRRTIFPKDCLEDQVIEKTELKTILEAANWAPTHNKTEPWRYIVFNGSSAVTSYLDFLDDFYISMAHKITEKEMEKFRKKMSGARKDWPSKCSTLIVIAMKRQHPDEDGNRMPEWEEICAVAMSVQNMHLMATAMGDIAGFWSSHTWCKRARDSAEMRTFLSLDCDEDRVFGAFVLGRYDSNKKQFRSNRKPIMEKVQIRCD